MTYRQWATWPAGSVVVAAFKYTWTTEILWGKRDSAVTLSRGEHLWVPGPLPQEESAQPLPRQAFIVFLGPLHQRWPSFTMQRYVSGGYLLQTKERVSAEYIKGGYLQCKGRSGWNRLCSISGRSSPDFGKIKILSKHLLPQGEGVLARASLIAV